MSTASPRRKRALLAGSAVAVLAAGPLLVPTSASATDSFEALASAYGFDYLMSNASIPAGVSPQFAGPTAQSQLTSLPSGTSFASFPYPGEVAAGLPGLINAAAPGTPQLPEYPFIVSSGLGEGEQQVNYPGIAMRAATEATNASAHAVFGTDGSGSVADSLITSDGGAVTATATARDSALSFGKQGDIASVMSRASVSRSVSGEITRSSSLAITGISIPALKFTVPSTNPAPAPFPAVPLPFAGQTLDAPVFGFFDGQFTIQIPGLGKQQYAVPNAAVQDAFKAAGFTTTFTSAKETANGIVGATFDIAYVAPAPPDNPLYSGESNFSVVFGRAVASVGGESAVAGTDSSFGAPAGATAASPATGEPADLAGALPAMGLTPGTGLTPGGTGVPTRDLISVGGVGDRVLRAGSVLDDPDALSTFYLFVIVAGLIGVFSIPTLRLLGVRSR